MREGPYINGNTIYGFVDELAVTRLPAAESGLLVTGSRADPRVGAQRAGWLVLVTVRGERGDFCQVALTTEEARAAAAELVEYADLLEGKGW